MDEIENMLKVISRLNFRLKSVKNDYFFFNTKTNITDVILIGKFELRTHDFHIPKQTFIFIKK